MTMPSLEAVARLETQKNIWFGCVRPDGRPHLSPVWFVWYEDKFYIGTDPKSVKVRNLRHNPHVVLALEDGTHPLICEGTACILQTPPSAGLLSAFLRKYEWDLTQEEQYNLLVEVTPNKWLSW